jgi:hypothetical protein
VRITASSLAIISVASVAGIVAPSRAQAAPAADLAAQAATELYRVRGYLYDATPRDAQPADCADAACFIAHRYADDPKAAGLAVALYANEHVVAGLGADEIFDGNYRGKIHLVPQLPTGKYRVHLENVTQAIAELDAFATALQALPGDAMGYRWVPQAILFVRSPGKRTPSAYAWDFKVTYNLDGSLMTSAASIRETMFHEMFHNNDDDAGQWSSVTLGADYKAIVKKCGTRVACLDPYAPNVTKVRGGTYYAFQPNNGDGVKEYAAELAVRYFDEQAQMMRDKKLSKRAFKCGPAENARAWHALVEQFFGGRDLVPAC